MSEKLTITVVALISGRTLTPEAPRTRTGKGTQGKREHTMDEGGVTFFLLHRTERIHVPWTSILYMETKA